MLITFVTSMWGTKTSDQIWTLRERNGIYSEKEIPGKLTLKLKWDRVVAGQRVGEEGYSRERKRFVWRKWSQGGTWYVGTRLLGQKCPEWGGKETQGWEWEARVTELLSEVCCLLWHAPLLGHQAGSDMFLVPSSLWCGQDWCVPFTLDVRKWEAIKLSKINCHVVWALKYLPQKLVLVTWVLLIPYLLFQLGYSKEHHPPAGLVSACGRMWSSTGSSVGRKFPECLTPGISAQSLYCVHPPVGTREAGSRSEDLWRVARAVCILAAAA